VRILNDPSILGVEIGACPPFFLSPFFRAPSWERKGQSGEKERRGATVDRVVLLGLGHLERELGNEARAEKAYGEALVLFRQSQDRLGWADVLSALARLRSEGDPESAKQFYYEAAQHYESQGLHSRAERMRRKAKTGGPPRTGLATDSRH